LKDVTDTDVLIIGAGMAGLAAARRAQRDGVDFLLLEAGDRVGGRVATDETDGFLLDRGFQVVNTAYPRLAALVDLAALDLGCFRSGVLVRHGDRLERYAHPLRDPRGVPGMLESAVGGVGTVTDRVRLAAIIARYAALPPARLLDEPETTTAQAMSGLSPAMLDGLVRPYLTGVFADPELATSNHVLAMIVRSFVHGRIGLPRTGVGAVPAALAAPLPTERIRLHTPVERLSGTTAHTPSGPVRARVVLVATDPVTAARLLPELPAPVMHALTTVYHAASEPPLEEATLVLDGDGFARPGGPSIANTVVVSNAVPALRPARPAPDRHHGRGARRRPRRGQGRAGACVRHGDRRMGTPGDRADPARAARRVTAHGPATPSGRAGRRPVCRRRPPRQPVRAGCAHQRLAGGRRDHRSGSPRSAVRP
jgi:Flavin containing amine oxidoreductase